MIKLENFEINGKNIGKIVDIFIQDYLPRLNKLYAYYCNDNDILKKSGEKGKPNNRLACAYAKYITTLQTGYFMGIPVKEKSSDEEYLKNYTDILKDNFINDINFEMAKRASIYGYGTEIIYQNEDAETKIKVLDPRETILIFGNSMNEFLLSAIRYYTSKDIDGKEKEVAEIYTEREIRYFYREEHKKDFEEDEKKMAFHLFDDIPIVLYKNNEEMKSDFEDILGLNDAYDTSQSNTANDVDYFNDAYMTIEGSNAIADNDIDGEPTGKSEAEIMKESRIMYFPDGGSAKFLTKEINDSATENYKNRLCNDIHKFSLTPDLADEKFAGNLSGIAIKFKTIPLEGSATEKENKFRVALRKRCELVTNMINKKMNKDYDYRGITEEFTRNLPQNEKETTDTILSMSNFISHRTLLELLPQIEDVDEEISRIEEEKEEYDKRDFEFNVI